MRQAVNDNPVVQAAIIGVLAIVVGFLLLTRVMGGGGADSAEETPPATPAPVESTAESVAPATSTDPASAVPEAAAPEAALGAADGDFSPGPGLPAKVVDAYEGGSAIAILITRERGIEDGRLRAMTSGIEGIGDVAVFQTYARGIAEYSRITGGVDVSRVPALVVVRPREQSQGGMPLASVSYGFRSPASAEQAVRDALYDGPRDLPYSPQ